MCKVLIVDDEAYICKLIENLIDWESLGMWIAGVANDGQTAYQMIQEYQPDIVISDIRMAGYDGIELIRHAREAGIEASFIFISGYRQFEYAQNAMKYGAVDYLLKPINKEELTRVLQNMKEQLEERLNHQKQKEEMQQVLKKNSHLAGRQLIEYLNNKAAVTGQELEKNCEFHMDHQMARFAVLKLSAAHGEPDPKQVDFILQKMALDLEAECAREGGRVIRSEQKEEMTALFVYPEDLSESVSTFVSYLWRRYQIFVQDYGNYELTVGCGPAVGSPEQLPRALRAACQALDLRFLYGTNRQLELTDCIPKVLSFQETFYGGMREMAASLEAFDYERFRGLVVTYFDSVKNDRRAIPENLFEGLDAVAQLLRETYATASETDVEQVRQRPRLAGTYEQLKAELLRLVKQRMDTSYEEKRFQEEQPIRIAKRYIEENFAGNVSLEGAADHAGLNPNYFSVLFKKITGQNFSEYLTDCRMEEAKKLLRTTTKNLAEVGMAVGYKDAKYFSRLFTRTVGLKPNEYRKLYS